MAVSLQHYGYSAQLRPREKIHERGNTRLQLDVLLCLISCALQIEVKVCDLEPFFV